MQNISPRGMPVIIKCSGFKKARRVKWKRTYRENCSGLECPAVHHTPWFQASPFALLLSSFWNPGSRRKNCSWGHVVEAHNPNQSFFWGSNLSWPHGFANHISLPWKTDLRLYTGSKLARIHSLLEALATVAILVAFRLQVVVRSFCSQIRNAIPNYVMSPRALL